DRAFETPATGDQEATVYLLKGDICVSITIETTAAMGSAKDRVIELASAAAGWLATESPLLIQPTIDQRDRHDRSTPTHRRGSSRVLSRRLAAHCMQQEHARSADHISRADHISLSRADHGD